MTEQETTNMSTGTSAPTATLSAAKRELLAKRRRGLLRTAESAARIPRRPASGPAPLSFAQQPLWFLHQLDPNSAAYHMPVCLRVAGRLHVRAFEQALDAVIARHEILRTIFVAEAGVPRQIVQAPAPLALPVIDLQDQPAEARREQAERFLVEQARKPFDLTVGPLLRCHLVRLAEDEHLFSMVVHHLVFDGWSIGVFCQELEQCYHAFLNGTAPTLPELPIQYADYAAWQEQTFTSEHLAPHLNYWRTQLTGARLRVDLPTDLPPPAQISFEGDTQTLVLPREVAESLRTLAQREGTTLFTVLATGLFILLNRWCRQDDLILGTVVAGRTRRELESLAGCFMNFLPLRARVNPAGTGLDLMRQVQQVALEASAHQECPFEKIVEAVKPARKPEKNPLFNVGLLLQNYSTSLFSQNGLRSEFVDVDMQVALLDLRFLAEEKPDGLALTCEFDVDLFEPGTILKLLPAYREVLEELARAPSKKITEIARPGELTRPTQAAQSRPALNIAIAANFTAEPVTESLRFWLDELRIPGEIQFAPYNQLFQQLLDPQSLLRTNSRGLNVLLVRLEDFGRTGEHEADFSALGGLLEKNVPELTRALQSAPRTATPWLICLCPPSTAALEDAETCTLLAHWEEKLAAALKTLNGIHVVTAGEMTEQYPVAEYDDPQSNRLGHVPYTPLFFVALGTLLARKLHAMLRPPKKVIALDCDNTLWSGIVGEDGPQGIQLEPERLFLQKFMRERREAGMLLCLCTRNNPPDVAEAFQRRAEMPLRLEHIAAQRVNWQPKSENLRALARELNLGLDSFILLDDNPVECAEVAAGCPEALALELPPDLATVPQYLRHVWVFDQLKVTTEDRQRAAMQQQNQMREQFAAAAMSLGDFIAGLKLQIDIQPAQPEHLARVAQLTMRTNQFNCTTVRRSEAEIAGLSQAGKAEILVVNVRDRFGDYGLVGVIILEKRAEALVVDTLLLSCRALGKGVEHRMLAALGNLALERGLRRVDVLFKPTAKNQPALEFLSAVGSPFHKEDKGRAVFHFPAEVAARVSFDPQRRPVPPPAAPPPSAAAPPVEPAIPTYTRYDWIARNASDPVQIQQLIEARTSVQPAASATTHHAPETQLERQLCEIWQRLLRAERVGIRDDFFALGGTSLLAVRMIAELEKASGQKLPLATVFKTPTIEQLARALEQKPEGDRRTAIVPIQPRGNRPPLFLVHGAGGGILWGYANLSAHLGEDQPVYALEPGPADVEQPASVEALAAVYVENIRATQPHGPYYLGGYCFGGYIAYEIARLLRAGGEAVGLLALLDSAAPNGSYFQVPWWRPGYYPRFLRNAVYWLQDFRQLDAPARRNFMRRKLKVFQEKLVTRVRKQDSIASPIMLEEYIDISQFPEHERQLWRLHLTAGKNYVPKPYPGKVTLLRTRGQPLFCSLDPQYGWRELADAVEVRRVPGAHENIFIEPEVKTLAMELRAALEAAQRQMPPAGVTGNL